MSVTLTSNLALIFSIIALFGSAILIFGIAINRREADESFSKVYNLMSLMENDIRAYGLSLQSRIDVQVGDSYKMHNRLVDNMLKLEEELNKLKPNKPVKKKKARKA